MSDESPRSGASPNVVALATARSGGSASGAAKGGSARATRGPRRTITTGSTFALRHGRRQMNTYPITEGELGELFNIGLIAAVCFSLSTGLVGFAIDVHKDLALASTETQTDVI